MTVTAPAPPAVTDASAGTSPLQTVRGDTSIAPRAIMRIARRAVREAPHVRMAEATGLGAVANRLRREPPVAASVETGGGWASLHLRLVVDWPCAIQEVADHAASVVAQRVHELTGVRIDAVDVEVTGLRVGSAGERRVR